jgi:hypothetical protein
MIALLGATAITLTALQATINAPTEAFRGCLREAASKATSEKVGGDAIEAYLRTACTAQMDELKSALIAFRVKNGMAKKTAASDADMTVDDYVATPVEKYQFMATLNAPKAAAPAATPAPTPAAVSTKPQ